MRKIAFVSSNDWARWGGSEELWSQTAAHLSQQGHSVGVNVKYWPVPVPEVLELSQAGCQIETRKPVDRLGRLARRIIPKSHYDWLNQFQPELVVISQGAHSDGINWATECIKRNVPYVLIAQAAAVEWWPSDESRLEIANAYEHAIASFFVSEANLELSRTHFCSDIANAQIVRNPFNVSYDADPPWPIEDSVTRLACVGRLQPAAKGQDILIEVLDKQKWRNRPLYVSFVGSGINSESLKLLVKRAKLQNVSFGGFQANIESMWSEHHALILPSRHEGLPLAVVEAMLCGRPCIVTDVAGNRELIEDNVNGFLAAAPTVDLLDEAMERAWQRRVEWQHIGQKASMRVRELVPRDPIEVFARELLHLLP